MRVLLCDDHPVYRDGLRLLLAELGLDVVGEAATGEDAVAAAERLVPDVVVMDLHLPGIDGVEATRRITSVCPGIGVLVLTMLEDDSAVVAALRAGASGYLLKGSGRAEVHRALLAVADGDVVVAGSVAGRLRERLRPDRSGVFAGLSDREAEVLDLVARGRTNEQIAQGLFLSVKTVRNNVSMILAKLGARSRAEAVAIARDNGMGASSAGPTG